MYTYYVEPPYPHQVGLHLLTPVRQGRGNLHRPAGLKHYAYEKNDDFETFSCLESELSVIKFDSVSCYFNRTGKERRTQHFCENYKYKNDIDRVFQRTSIYLLNIHYVRSKTLYHFCIYNFRRNEI